MKRILSVAMMFALSVSQAFSYSTDTLKRVADLSEAFHAASTVIEGVSRSGASEEMQLIGGISREVNNLMSYALMDSSFMSRVTRVIDCINKGASWQKAPAIDGQFFKEFTLSLTYGIAKEAKGYFRGKGVELALQHATDNRIVARASQALGEAISASLVDIIFSRLNHLVVGEKGTEAPKCSEVLVESFVGSLATELAYHFAGEVILRNAIDTKSKDLFSDIFGSCN